MTSLYMKLAGLAGAVALVGAVLFGAYRHGVTTTSDRYDAVIAKADAQHATETLALQLKVAATERAKQVSMAELDTHYQEVIQNEKQSADSIIADLRSGTIGLRKRLAAVSVSSSGVPCTAAGAGCGDDEATVGLQVADAQLLVRLAAEADAIVDQLNACQAVVKADRTVK
jgi:prophage endopeptidase